MAEEKRRKRLVNLKRNCATSVTGLRPADVIRPVWDAAKGRWMLIIESTNGVEIQHVRLTCGQETA